jgi:carbamoyltransferase
MVNTTPSKPSYILGFSCYFHDAAACLLKDGVIIAAAEEERFTRKKHDSDFPINAIKWCLKDAGITMQDIDEVSFYEKPLLKFERLLYQHLQSFPKSLPVFVRSMPSWFDHKLKIHKSMKKQLGWNKDITFVTHHLAHAASTFLVSPFKEAAILTVDGVGEWETTTMGVGKGNDITLTKTIDFPHSLGLLYSTITALLGFSVNNSEYKVMGLAPYGKPKYMDEFRKIVNLKEDGSYALDMSHFRYTYADRMPSRKLQKLLCPIRHPNEPVTQEHKDIAASLQKITEEALFAMARQLRKETKMQNLCMAGGVALNSVANGKILKETGFKRIYIQPAAGDSGTSIGTAHYVYNSVLKKPRVSVMTSAYLGPQYSRQEVKSFLDTHGIKYSEFTSDEELVTTTAKLINDKNVVGWHQGRMEWGPRALGARSILANPCLKDMKDILNLKVKHREAFRPFAPVVCVDDAPDYFECDKPIPLPTDFMLMVYPIKKEKRRKLPAVTHVDGSGRLQTIRKDQHPRYYKLIKEFGKLSGVPILVNTSFNIRGEPIVCSPYDSYKCMMGTGIDYLVMEDFLIKRADNPQHIWDSEKYADD